MHGFVNSHVFRFVINQTILFITLQMSLHYQNTQTLCIYLLAVPVRDIRHKPQYT